MKKILLTVAILCASAVSFADAKADYANAQKLAGENKITEAVKVLEKIAASGEKEYVNRANFDLGLYYLQRKDNVKAKKYLSEVWNKGAAATPEALEAAKWLHTIASINKNTKEAEEYIVWADKQTQGKDVDIASSLVIFYYENNMQQKGQAKFNEAAKSADKNFVAELNYNVGQYFIEKNDLAKAKKHLQDAYKGSPNAILPAGYLLVNIALFQKDNATAEKYLLEMDKQSQGKNSDVLGMLGTYYIGVNNAAKAEEYLKKSVAANSKNGESLLKLLAIYENKKDTANVNSTYSKLKAIVPKGLNKELGITFANLGNADLSEKYFKKAINEDKDNEAKVFLGQLYFLTGKQSEGLELVKQAVSAKVKGASEVLKEMETAMKNPATPQKK